MRFGDKTTCVVTGGLGFIGSHFVRRALDKGWTIINIDKVTYASLDVDFNDHPGYTHIKEDIAEIDDIPYCQLIVNFAAESHVDNSIAGSEPFITSNFYGVYNILELLRKKCELNAANSWQINSPLFFQISTDEVFGDILDGAFKENDGFNPSNPYSASKAAAEMLVKAWGRTYGTPYLISRTTNNYGPGQHPEKLIPMAITRCLNDEKLLIHGSGEYVRNWIHVEDNVDAIFAICQNGEIGESYNISSDEEASVVDIAKMILNHFGKEFSPETVNNSLDRSGCDLRYALDSSKTKALGWSCQRSLEDSLESIVSYYRARV